MDWEMNRDCEPMCNIPMTLLDYFSGQALVSIATTSVIGGNANVDEMAVASYRIADAMLEARK